MDEEKKSHRQFAVDLFNYVWTLLEKPERTQGEADEMVHAAHASRYHWGKAGTAVNLARGEWQISRVYSVLSRPEPALYHAHRCLEICQDNGIGDFDLAYAYEALARAYNIAGKPSESRHYLLLANEAGEHIAEQEDKDLLLDDLGSISPLEMM
jgi:hypothetical protein